MLVKILKAFPYAEDGIRIRELAEGAVEDVRDELVEGLKAEGFIACSEPNAEMREHIHAPAHDEHVHQPAWDEPSRNAGGHGHGEPTESVADPAPVADAYPHMSAAQVEALDNVNDGVLKPGGSPKGGNRKHRG
jgi:hypothetical protein